MTSASLEDPSRHPVEVLAEEYAQRMRAGEQPSIEEYVQRYPEHADLLRSVLPSIAMVERVSLNDARERPSSSPHPSRASMPVPPVLGDFHLIREIGRGGMGIVYEAIQQSLNRRVALKVIGGHISDHPKHKSRFRREAEAAASLHHTNIVPIYGIGEDHGLQYYAMQLIDGVTLSNLIGCLQYAEDAIETANELVNMHHASTESTHRNHQPQAFRGPQAVRWMLSKSTTGPIPSHRSNPSLTRPQRGTEKIDRAATQPALDVTRDGVNDEEHQGIALSEHTPTRSAPRANLNRDYFRNVARIVANAANALDYAHHQRILHRDIKPANLLLDREGTLWITDFGLARRTDLEEGTQAGEVLGTLRYMAPEQIAGHGDARIDIYSLGLTLYELLTLRPAIDAPQARLLEAHRNAPIPSPRSIQPNVPLDLQTITLKACAHAPEDRYERASEFEEDLLRFLDDRPILAKRASQIELLVRWARRNPAIASLTSATLVLLIWIAGLLAVWNRQQEHQLLETKKEFQRAEKNLTEKTAALSRVEQEHARAEKNLDLAMKAFEQITNNIASRGSTLANGSGLDDDELLEFSGVTLSQADVELLESLIQFFERFSQENSKDLRIEAAMARQRVGDIQHKLGKLDQAEESYQLAANVFQRANGEQSDNVGNVLPLISIYNELLVVCAKRGQLGRSMTYYQDARQLLDASPQVKGSSEGRFALAKLLNSIGTLNAKLARDPRLRPNAGLFPRPFAATPINLGPAQLVRMKRDAEYNAEALSLLEDLVRQEPNHEAYQIVLARSLRDEVRIARIMSEIPRAEEALHRAIEIFEKLGRQHPDSAAIQYELADTLSTVIGLRPADQERCRRALTICDRIARDNPQVPEYRALQASTLVRLSQMSGRTNLAEELLGDAITIQRDLSQRYSDVAIYSIGLAQSLFQMAELKLARNQLDKAKESIDQAIEVGERIQKTTRARAFLNPYIDRLRERRAVIENRLSKTNEK